MMIQLQNLLFVDDLNPGPVVELLSKTYRDTNIEWLRQKEAVYERLQHCSQENTVILLNVHIRFNDYDLRSNFLGMRFLRKELRTERRRREAVVVYSPLSPEVFLKIPINRILFANVGHYYYHIINLRSIVDIVESAKPIETEGDLDEIIQRYGYLSGLIRTFKHDLENALSVIGLGECSRTNYNTITQIENIVQDISVLIPQRFHREFQSEQLRKTTHQLIDQLQSDKKTDLKAYIIQIRSILSSYNKLCEQFFKAYK